MRQSYLVCYDICDDKRLRKVFKVMRGFGDHLQYSVFECQFTSRDLVRCRAELAASSITMKIRFCSSISARPKGAATG